LPGSCREPLEEARPASRFLASGAGVCFQGICRHNPGMRADSLHFLQKLLNTPSPPGHEARGQRVWLDYVTTFADETFTDAYGNAVAILNKGGSPRVMLAGHADEIAMTVNYIDPHGFIYVRNLGGVDP